MVGGIASVSRTSGLRGEEPAPGRAGRQAGPAHRGRGRARARGVVNAPIERGKIFGAFHGAEHEQVGALAVGEPGDVLACLGTGREAVDPREHIHAQRLRIEPLRVGASHDVGRVVARSAVGSPAATTRSTTSGSTSGQSPVMRTTRSAPVLCRAERSREDVRLAAAVAATLPRRAPRRVVARPSVVASTTSSTRLAARPAGDCRRHRGAHYVRQNLPGRRFEPVRA